LDRWRNSPPLPYSSCPQLRFTHTHLLDPLAPLLAAKKRPHMLFPLRTSCHGRRKPLTMARILWSSSHPLSSRFDFLVMYGCSSARPLPCSLTGRAGTPPLLPVHAAANALSVGCTLRFVFAPTAGPVMSW
jgi:hypothetical protein